MDKENKKAYDKQWKRENRDRINAARRAFAAEHRELRRVPIRKIEPRTPLKQAIRREVIRFENGWVGDSYEVAMHEQDGKCAICGKLFLSEMEVNADHCHTTGKHRALLCKVCNWRLGMFEKDIETFAKFTKYVEKWNAINTTRLD